MSASHQRSRASATILRLAAVAVVLSVADPPAALAQPAPAAEAAPAAAPDTPAVPEFLDLRRIEPIRGDAQAGESKSTVCAACHGAQGVAVAPTFPNLVGQRPDYMYWQLVAFKNGARPDSPMTPLAAALSDADMRDLATYYAGLALPEPSAKSDLPQADANMLRQGEQLYMQGDVAKGVPPCQGCHGADARGYPLALVADGNGHTPFAVFPSLRSQQLPYLQARLAAYHGGQLHGSTAERAMSSVGQRLDETSMQALVAWLSSLPLNVSR